MKLKLYQAIEVPVPNGSTLTRFFIQDQPQLRNAYIKGIQFYTPSVITATPLTGSTPATLADMRKAYLTLVSGDLQVVYNMPILNLNEIDDATSPFTWNLPEIQDITVSWVKSYIQLASAAATTNVAFSFGVYYELPQ